MPRLGAYLAVPVHCGTVLTEENFDAGLRARLQYYREVEELEAARREELEEMFRDREEIERKIGELREKGADTGNIEPLEA